MAAAQKVSGRRYIASFIGIIIAMGGTALISLTALGTSPVSSPMFALSLGTPLSFGAWTFILNTLFIVAQMVLLRGDFPRAGWWQFPALAVASFVLDGWMAALAWTVVDSYVIKVLVVLIGICVAGFGISLLAASRALYLPGEGLVAAISEVTGKPFPRIKIAFDVCNVAVALVLCVVLVGNFEAVREATVISAVGIGFMVGRFLPLSQRLAGHVPPPRGR